MIINGGSRSQWRFFANHLMKDDNDLVAISEIRGLASNNVLDGLREMAALASGTRCKNFFYHANINPRVEDQLTPEQWDKAIDILEQKLGLTNHSRIVVEHQKEGRSHKHVLWSRINTDTMTAVSDSHNYQIHEAASREIEQVFGHDAVVGAFGRDGKRPERNPANWETFRSQQTKIDPKLLTQQVTELWQHSENGQAFVAALAEQGLQLCRGDRRDFCLIDTAGDVHSLARRINGVKAADIRAKMQDVDIAQIPTIAAAKELVSTATIAPPSAMPEITATPLDTFAQSVQQVMAVHQGDPQINDDLDRWARYFTVLDSAMHHMAVYVKGYWQNVVSHTRTWVEQHGLHGHDR